ncbi:hypothetical protein TNIN_92301 [Trichonephila inaurata madagascariensis]|uniref:Uncharacterized protein n=1 Tax=Trichonephila inaurata madagascariensis TaxID=2747483 RepID=A0A8X7BR69_9ARAC|nr:hypothetical protein TNIN_92301 [Trichonephila inaurata madagascariensis]
MASLGVKESILRQISANDVFEELKASNEINSTYMEMLMSIKKTDAYKSLRNVAVDHISDILTSKKDTLLEASIQKRKQIFEIQRMIRNIDSTISEKISRRLRKEDSKIAVKKAIKRLSNKRQNVESIKKSPGSLQVVHKNYKLSRSIVEERSPKTQKAKNQEVLGSEINRNSKKTRSPRSAASKSALSALADARPARARKPNPKYFGEEMTNDEL